jgi:hypothetical protein
MTSPVEPGLPKRRSDVLMREVDGEMVILDRKTGLIYQLNTTASRVWEWCDGSRTATELAEMVVRAFDVDPNTATDWPAILSWLEGSSAAATRLYLLLTYLRRHGLVRIDPEIMRRLATLQRSFGRVSLGLAHVLIDRCVVDGVTLGGRRNFEILWDTLLLAGSPARKISC